MGVLTAATIAVSQALAAAPALAGEPAVGLTDTNQLVFFDTDTPGRIVRTIAITGLAPTEGLLAIDFRPGGGTDALARRLYAVSAMSRIYTIDLYTGAATAVPGTATPPRIDAVRHQSPRRSPRQAHPQAAVPAAGPSSSPALGTGPQPRPTSRRGSARGRGSRRA